MESEISQSVSETVMIFFQHCAFTEKKKQIQFGFELHDVASGSNFYSAQKMITLESSLSRNRSSSAQGQFT